MQVGALISPEINAGLIVEVEKFDYKNMQKAVGGLIERAYLSKELEDMHIDAYVNEEGKIRDLRPSAIVYDKEIGDCQEGILDIICGPILFVGHDGEGGTIGLSEEQKDYIANNLVEFVQAVNNDDPEDTLNLMIFRR